MGDALRNNRRILAYVVVSNFLLYFGFRVWETTFNNFAVEVIGVGPAGIGWVQALREIPGLLAFLLGFLALYLSEMRIMAVSIIIMGAGLLLTGEATNVPFLLASTVVMSIGFHYFMPNSDAVLLMVTEKEHAPKTLGQMASLGSVASVAGTLLVLLFADAWGYRTLFVVVGAAIMVGGLALLPAHGPKDALPSGRRVVVRRKYWLYYTLSFLMGSRRHIFTTFAVFLLVRDHGINIQTTAILFLINNLVSVVTLRLVGRLIGKVGERVVLSIAFGVLIFVFLGYAFVSSLPVLFGLFVIDNIVYSGYLALPTYFQKIAVTREEITSNLAVEQTINHIAAVVIPVLGGTVWVRFGSQAPFLVGAIIVALSLVLAQAVRTPARSSDIPTATMPFSPVSETPGPVPPALP